MLELKKGQDILSEIGLIKTLNEAKKVFTRNLSITNSKKLSKITNKDVLLKIANAISMCKPKEVFIHTGTKEDITWIKNYSIEKGEEQPLPMKNHTIHFDLPEDQGRLVNQTFYIVNKDEKLSPLSKGVKRIEAYTYVKEHMTGIMSDKTMIIGFYSRGPLGAKGSTPAIEITSSTYVIHSADILYRNIFQDFDKEVDRKGIFFTNLHSEGPNRSEDISRARIFMDRSWFTTYSTFCTYAGNTLLMKKGNHRFSVDYNVYHKKGEELSEHMFITGMKGPNGRITYFAGAAPSGCGKTTTAMAGDVFIGDDLAQLWISEDGSCRGVNPEKGIFGIVEDVNKEGDPHLMKKLREEGAEVIWSNVLIDETGTPHWTGNGEPPPNRGRNFQGDWWLGKTDINDKPIPMSHPNSRCTLKCEDIETYDTITAEDPTGVPIKIFTYSGRDADTMPPIWVAKSADEGVAIGASVVSKATATEVGATGVRRQPWANAPFIPGPLGNYMQSQFDFFNNPQLSNEGKPILSGLNYFLTHDNRGEDQPGLLGEKRDVKVWLGWLELYAHHDVEAIETPIGYIPRYEDLKKLFMEKINKEYNEELYTKQFSLYIDNLIKRVDLQSKAYKKEGDIPQKLFDIFTKQKRELEILRSQQGPIVEPQKLIRES